MATSIVETAVLLAPPPISIATPSRDNLQYTTTKGLLNGPGQNNCFLNSAVQVLWHLDVFRRSFRDLSGHACMAESCIFCALKELFSQLQFSNETALPPDALRRALAESFLDQQRFQLGFMDDAAECFENILLRIHAHIAHNEAEDMCNARHCIPHQKFAMTLVEQSVCAACGATSEPLSYTQMVHYVSTSTLVYQVRTNPNRTTNSDFFGQMLRKAGSMGDVRVCPSACGAVIQISRTLMNRPEIVSVGLVWNSERPTLDHIMEVFSTIGTTLRLRDVFNTVIDTRWAESCMHHLVGVVTYYGKHYSTFFFHTKLRIWIYFDDATVREIGPRWEQVVEKCRKGRYQPLLLLYACPDGTPVNTDHAPKQITAYQQPLQKLRRALTPNPEKPVVGAAMRRAITPRPYNDYQNLAIIQSCLYGGTTDQVDSGSTLYKNRTMIHRTLSNGSSSTSGVEMMDQQRRDSGNWSGDRNSASSSTSSSSAIENGYPQYFIGATNKYDPGYDSYSLSSNDSQSMSTLQHLMKMGHLAKIPEHFNNNMNGTQLSCDVLCDEADELLVKSRQLEDEHDLVLALALCNAAATKARAAMNAPYNNPKTMTLARMKHNTCIMRARSLHRRMAAVKEAPPIVHHQPEIRHTRDGSSGSGGGGNSGRTIRHSRQNSRETVPVSKTLEIYATLPKKRPTITNKEVIYDKPPPEIQQPPPQNRESRLFGFARSKKRSRSEDRNNAVKPTTVQTTPPVVDDKKTKKQHKIRRKLLMGGLIKRKNRSMPDLSDITATPKPIRDDSRVGLKTTPSTTKPTCGYLSEGHQEYNTTNTTNPKLEKSKLMRRCNKVPPPPPVRTTSQLTPPRDEIDCCRLPPSVTNDFDLHQLPPYPSPLGSVIHSRQASEEFPPPPTDLDLSALEEHLPIISTPGTLLAQVQMKRQQILSDNNNNSTTNNIESIRQNGDIWLRELQAKQAALRQKRQLDECGGAGIDVINTQRYMAVPPTPQQIAEELREVELLNAAIKAPPHINNQKKKSVSFCDQVILVEEQEDDSYIPNPILERVLRSANTVQKPLYYRHSVGTTPVKAVVTPIVVNNANNSVPMGKTKCNLCRKKVVCSVNLYCTDCEFYMSRFQPKIS